jgi:hypothetical protein
VLFKRKQGPREKINRFREVSMQQSSRVKEKMAASVTWLLLLSKEPFK